MAFVDEIKVFMKAGRGGDGVVRWLHEKGKEFGGPSGGDGGDGGSIYARAVRDLNVLARYRYKKKFKAPDGVAGEKKSMHGKDGTDLIIDVPVGAVITNLDTGKRYEFLKEGERTLLLMGGQGGWGNEHFKSSRNIRPIEAVKGEEGEEARFLIELELIADGGLIGLPNAGKSSLLNALTNAHAKVGAYAFTTLNPNLGDLFGLILADIPGLIEGASSGRGLGFTFLRHIKRTKIIIHCISLENANISDSYEVVRKELETYGEGLSSKPEVIVFTKSDLVSPETVSKAVEAMKEVSLYVFAVSIYDEESIKYFQDHIVKILRNLGE